MMKLIRNILSIFVVSLLIAATGGVSIYHHICNCAGSESASIFLETSCDHENSAVPASCCSVVETHSCCTEEPVNETKTACQKDDCCKTSSQFLKISDSFQPGLGKISLKSYTVASVLVFIDFLNEYHQIPSLNLFNTDLPPPDSGRQIILALHQLKIAPPLV